MLREAFRERVRVGVAGLGEELGFAHGTVLDRREVFLCGPRQVREPFRNWALSPRGHVRGRDGHHAHERGALFREREHVERGDDVGFRRVSNREIEFHARRAVNDVGRVCGDERARVCAEAALCGFEIARDDIDTARPIVRQRGEQFGVGDFVSEAFFRREQRAVTRLTLANQHANAIDPERVFARQEIVQDHLAYEAGDPGEKNVHEARPCLSEVVTAGVVTATMPSTA